MAVAWPSADQPTFTRVATSTRAASLNVATPGSRASSPTRTSVSVISAWWMARSAPLPVITSAS